ncbi:MAG: molybdenum cofactor biosysynthesis protein [Opitutales bacterium]|nr:molybdenum cofactor biosysynthesis protein [Opitutales bacterium]
MIQIEHIFISPGHNFFGHHGKPAGENEVVAVDSIECVAGSGIRGDRFFDHKPDYKGQITFFSMEVFEALCEALNVSNISPSAVRRNVFTRGVDLDQWIGKEFEIQGIRFSGAEECKPCYWMDQAIAPGAEAYLKGRGGLRARILSDGVLKRTA